MNCIQRSFLGRWIGRGLGRLIGWALNDWMKKDGPAHVLHVLNRKAPIFGCPACMRDIAAGKYDDA